MFWSRRRQREHHSAPAAVVPGEWERLWRVHDELMANVVERRARAGVELLVNAAILAAAVAVALDPAMSELARGHSIAGVAEAFVLILSAFAVLVAYIGLSPGLPWERRPGPELIGWVIGLVIGASVRGVRAQGLRALYDSSPFSRLGDA